MINETGLKLRSHQTWFLWLKRSVSELSRCKGALWCPLAPFDSGHGDPAPADIQFSEFTFLGMRRHCVDQSGTQLWGVNDVVNMEENVVVVLVLHHDANIPFGVPTSCWCLSPVESSWVNPIPLQTSTSSAHSNTNMNTQTDIWVSSKGDLQVFWCRKWRRFQTLGQRPSCNFWHMTLKSFVFFCISAFKRAGLELINC